MLRSFTAFFTFAMSLFAFSCTLFSTHSVAQDTMTHPSSPQKTMVEAVGQGLVIDGNISQAREIAMSDAKQQASLQASAYISTTQQLENGILEIDNMRISTLSTLRNIEIIDEKLRGNTLFVRIKAEVDTDTACLNGSSGNSFRKSVAFAAFPLAHPNQANLGQLSSISSGLSTALANRLRQESSVYPLNASQLQLFSNLNTASTQQLDNGVLTTLMSNAQQLDTQYIVSGVIRDLSMNDPSVMTESNWLKDTYNKLDYKSDKHLRHFSIDLFIHDGFSGSLLEQQHYETAGKWPLDSSKRTGFATPAFNDTDYGQKINALLDEISRDLVQSLRCLPFSSRITQVDNNQVWINSGLNSGLSRGDKLTVYRKNMFFNQTGQSTTELINTNLTLTLDDIQPTSARGRIDGSVSEHNIQPQDIVMFW